MLEGTTKLWVRTPELPMAREFVNRYSTRVVTVPSKLEKPTDSLQIPFVMPFVPWFVTVQERATGSPPRAWPGAANWVTVRSGRGGNPTAIALKPVLFTRDASGCPPAVSTITNK